jgi:hypothetical protein
MDPLTIEGLDIYPALAVEQMGLLEFKLGKHFPFPAEHVFRRKSRPASQGGDS